MYSKVSIKRTVPISIQGKHMFQIFLLSIQYNIKICDQPLDIQVSIKRTGCVKLFKTQ